MKSASENSVEKNSVDFLPIGEAGGQPIWDWDYWHAQILDRRRGFTPKSGWMDYTDFMMIEAQIRRIVRAAGSPRVVAFPLKRRRPWYGARSGPSPRKTRRPTDAPPAA
jgi:hypothetical protein